MHDIKFIRENPEAFDAGLRKRSFPPQSHRILEIDRLQREWKGEIEAARSEKKLWSSEYGKWAASGQAEGITAQIAKGKSQQAAAKIANLETRLADQSELQEILESTPNLPSHDVPAGNDEKSNRVMESWGDKPTFHFEPKEHSDLGPPLGLDFKTGALISGARFTFLRGQMARLHRAIGQFMIDHQIVVNGFQECAPPLLVRQESLFGTGQLPKFEADNFKTTDGRWLIPTAEVSLTNSVRDQILVEDTLPLRMVALTPCFRSEAGSAGKDTKGFIRQHQFDKVELVSICRPEQSEFEHTKMAQAAESVLFKLGLPFRKVLLCAGDMGFTARKTFDLEVWLPGQDNYREISSISNCGDFQARRMNTRYRPEGQKGTEFVHTLNGSGLAVGRTLVAVLENYQQADGSVEVPPALLPYMGGITALVPA